jgi:hypothetical protein
MAEDVRRIAFVPEQYDASERRFVTRGVHDRISCIIWQPAWM